MNVKRFVKWLLLGCGILGIIFSYLYISVGKAGKVGVYSSAQQVPAATAAIVLGAKVFPNGNVSAIVEDRLKSAIELYKAHKVQKVLLTGDHGQTNYDEVNTMRRYMLKQGIPEQDIFMDHAGFSTYESMYRARDVFQVKDAIVVTQRFHLPRSLYIARNLGIKANGLIADRRSYGDSERNEHREILAKVKAVLQVVILHSTPTYLGPAIPISGDGRVTCDKI